MLKLTGVALMDLTELVLVRSMISNVKLTPPRLILPNESISKSM